MEKDELKTLNEWGKDLGKKLQDLADIRASDLVDIAQQTGRFLCGGKYRDTKKKEPQTVNLKVNQVRRFLDAVRRIESVVKGKEFDSTIEDSITLLRVKLAYAAGREEHVKPLMNVLDPAIRSGAKSQPNFEKLLRLVEGIIAYHRFYGGTN